MGQRVNIQYSVEIDELQKEVNRLFSNAIAELDKVQPVGGAPVAKLGTDGLEKVDAIRQSLAKVDIMLGDVQNIIEGYVRFKTEPPAERQIPFQQTSEELEIEQLEDQIAKFKEFIVANATQEFENKNKFNIDAQEADSKGTVVGTYPFYDGDMEFRLSNLTICDW